MVCGAVRMDDEGVGFGGRVTRGCVNGDLEEASVSGELVARERVNRGLDPAAIPRAGTLAIGAPHPHRRESNRGDQKFLRCPTCRRERA